METKPSTLVILSPGFPKDEADSTCLPSQQNFVKALNRNYPELQIIILAFQYPFTSGTYSWFGNTVIAFSGRNRGKVFRLILWQRILEQLKIIHTENNLIGLLTFWCGEAALIGNRFGKKYGLKHFCWIRGQDAKKDNKYVKRINPEAKELIALSDFLADEFLASHGIKPFVIIPNGIDTQSFPLITVERDIDILGAGSLIPLKQFEVFISLVKDLKKYFPKIKAEICGGGPEDKQLKKLLEEYELQDNLSMVGELKHAVVISKMQRSKILLHTSNYEGFPAVCLEALYAGCHVISFVQPMKKEIEHWYIVKNKETMLQATVALLKKDILDHTPVLPYPTNDSARFMMKLFSD